MNELIPTTSAAHDHALAAHEQLTEAKQAACRVALSVLSHLCHQEISSRDAAVLLKLEMQHDHQMDASRLESELSLHPDDLPRMNAMCLIRFEDYAVKLTTEGQLTAAGIIGAALIP